MIPATLREVISVSRKVARDFRQALEEVAELLRQRQLDGNLQRVPSRIPQRRPHHPLLGRSQNRKFSTKRTITTSASSGIKRFQFLNAYQKIAKSQPLTSSFKTAFSQVHPFGFANRVQFRAPNNLYRHFVNHNARMFSTYGASVSAQAAHNLSQGVRALFVKGAKLPFDVLHKPNIGAYNSTSSYVETDMKLASRVSETSDLRQEGCFVEFNLAAPSIESIMPVTGYFDEDLSYKFENLYEKSLEHQKKVMSDVNLFREHIGSTTFKFTKERLRFHIPNCEVEKMESLLLDNGISSGLVFKLSNNDFSTFGNVNSCLPGLESDHGSILSNSSSGSGSSFSEDSSFVDDVLSSSDDYFELSSTAMRV